MAVIKYIAPIVAAAGLAAAQSSCSVSGTTTITNAEQATGLSGCRTFTGTIAIATSASGSLSLPGIEEIDGSLIAMNAPEVNGLEADSLSSISDSFTVTNMTRLASLTFGRLTSVNKIDFEGLPALGSLSFDSGVNMAESVSVLNTFLSSLDGISLETADTVEISNNRYLKQVSMPLGNVSTLLEVTANGRDLTAEFPDLVWAAELTIANVSSLSLPSLKVVNGTAAFTYNDFDSLILKNLTSVGEGLSINNNDALTNASFPNLKQIGGALEVANNTALEEIDGFPKLAMVGGAVDCEGDFKSAEFPSITNVVGAFNLQSTQNINSTCSEFADKHGSDLAIQGQYECMTTNQPNSGTATGSNGIGGSSTSSGGDHTSSPSSAANAVVITGATGLLGVVAAIFGLL